MKRIFLFLALALFSLTTLPVHAGTQTFILKDGVKIRGQLVEFNNGVYIIKTSDGAQTRIRAKRVAKILTSKKKTKTPKKETPANVIAKNMMFDPEMIKDIEELDDPELLKILQKADFQKALQELKTPAQLETDPRTRKFYTNPQVKALLKKYATSKNKKKKTSAAR